MLTRVFLVISWDANAPAHISGAPVAPMSVDTVKLNTVKCSRYCEYLQSVSTRPHDSKWTVALILCVDARVYLSMALLPDMFLLSFSLHQSALSAPIFQSSGGSEVTLHPPLALRTLFQNLKPRSFTLLHVFGTKEQVLVSSTLGVLDQTTSSLSGISTANHGWKTQKDTVKATTRDCQSQHAEKVW